MLGTDSVIQFIIYCRYKYHLYYGLNDSPYQFTIRNEIRNSKDYPKDWKQLFTPYLFPFEKHHFFSVDKHFFFLSAVRRIARKHQQRLYIRSEPIIYIRSEPILYIEQKRNHSFVLYVHSVHFREAPWSSG